MVFQIITRMLKEMCRWILRRSEREFKWSLNHRTVNRYYNVPSDQILHFTEDTSATSGTSKDAYQRDLLGFRQLDVTGFESTLSLSIGSLKPGCYILRITSAGSAVTKQF